MLEELKRKRWERWEERIITLLLFITYVYLFIFATVFIAILVKQTL